MSTPSHTRTAKTRVLTASLFCPFSGDVDFRYNIGNEKWEQLMEPGPEFLKIWVIRQGFKVCMVNQLFHQNFENRH